MIIQTQFHLAQMLTGLVSFTGDALPETYNDADGALTHSPKVVRFNTSEYQELFENNVRRPHIAIQLREIDDNDVIQLRNRHDMWQHTDGTQLEVVKNDQPQMVRVVLQLDIRAPKDLWVSQISTEILRSWYPFVEQTLQAAPLGPAIGDLDFTVRYWFETPMRNSDPEDDVRARYFRETMLVRADTWLLPASSQGETTGTVNTVTVAYIDLDTDETIETTETT